MIPLMTAALALMIQGEVAGAAPLNDTTASNSAPAIRILVNNGGRFFPGDRVRIQIEPRDDGYLLVLRADTDGHIRVLFPIDPDLDPFVRGGRAYDVRGRADRESFTAEDQSGTGVIYAAISKSPLRFRDYMLGDHWDYDVLRLRDSSDDVEADFSQLVTRMTQGGQFDYDVVNYSVVSRYIITPEDYRFGGAIYTGYTLDPFYHNRFYDPYYAPYYYDPAFSCWRCGYPYPRSGLSINIVFGGGYYDPWQYAGPDFYRNRYGYYDPWYYGYNDYNYGYGHSSWNYPGQSRPFTVVNLPRPRVPTNTAYGLSSRPRPFPSTNPPNVVATGGGRTPPTSSSSPPPSSGSYQGGTRARPQVNPPSRQDPPPSSSGPTRAERPNSAPPSAGPVVGGSVVNNSGGARRRPDHETTPVQSSGTRSTSAPLIDRRTPESRPVFREPPKAEPPRNTPTRQSEPPRSTPTRQSEPPRSVPVFREPPRRDVSPPPSAPPSSSRTSGGSTGSSSGSSKTPPPPPPSSPPVRARPGGGY